MQAVIFAKVSSSIPLSKAPGNADRVRPYSVYSLEMLGMHQQACKFVFIKLQTEQNTEADVVDPALHGAVHGFGMVVVVVLRSCRMKLEVALFMVGFLEEDVGADACLLQFAVILNGGGGDIDVDAADIPVFMVDRVDRLDALAMTSARTSSWVSFFRAICLFFKWYGQ